MIHNRFIPFGSFVAINLFGFIIVRRGKELTAMGLRHEYIHTRQMREMLFIGFYLWYVVEWLVRLVQYRQAMKAYYAISFEREAYQHQADVAYLTTRRPFAWRHYLRRSVRTGPAQKSASAHPSPGA